MQKIFRSAVVLLAAFLFMPAALAAAEKAITLGVISKRTLAEVEPQYRDFVRYIARKLSAKAPVEGKVMTAATIPQLERLLEEDKVDFYMESPYPTYLINQQGDAIPLLRRWKSGVAEYHGVLFTKKDSGVNRVEDLRGQMIVLEDPGSTSGYFLPKVFLAGKGFKLAEKASLDTIVAPAEIGYIFGYSAARISDLVLTRKVVAGAFSNEDYDRLEPKKKAELVVLAETETFPRYFLSIRKELDPEIAGRLQDILLTMHQDAEGRVILNKLENTTMFDLAPGGEQAVRFKLQEVFGLPSLNPR
ncbi:MAG TPA: phosphate/phosphite/phosphonate ABC transporter substrate-binding protein [Verrucomicrobiae bacterium]|jgi:ABC-type phosphate/phosphonate transport system substrate-binding protein|nr:phosphate/phosphite/phosphonate ABC transporter substrate-binding protein [Verrucomicrobiae bacterium]